MAGWKEYAHEIRKRDSHYPGATGQHVAVYALDNNRVYIIDENGGLVDFQIKDGYFNNVQISGNCRIVGQQIITDTVIDGYDLIFNFDSEEVTGNMVDANPSGADWRMDVYSISGVDNGFNQLRIFDNNDGKTYISVRKDGSVIIGDYADTINDDGHTVQVYGSAIVTGELTSPKGSVSLFNEGFGVAALKSVTTGISNTAVGINSLEYNTTGNFNTAIGANSLRSNIDGTYNAAFGNASLGLNSSGVFNMAFGPLALANNTVGSNNVGVGSQSLYSNTIGNNNVAVGGFSLHEMTDGENNIAIGLNALYNCISGSGNVAIGYQAGINETGSNKLYITNSAGTSGDALIYGEFDVPHVYVNGRFTVKGKVSETSIESVSFIDGGTTSADTRYLFNKNTSGIASYTINFPLSPTNGQLFTFATRGSITTLTWGGGTANSTPSSVAANDRFTWVYNADDSIWMRTV